MAFFFFFAHPLVSAVHCVKEASAFHLPSGTAPMGCVASSPPGEYQAMGSLGRY